MANNIIYSDNTSVKLVLKILPKSNSKIQIQEEKNVKKYITGLGNHISKIDGCISKSIQIFISQRYTFFDNISHFPSCQMFLRNPRNGIGNDKLVDKSDIPTALNYINEHKINYFTHAPYIINLSKPFTKNNPNCEKWVLGLLSKDLQTTSAIGGKGVVVHVGKAVGMDINLALDRMELSIRTVLKDATEQCPLLLETPAGEGTELCSTIEQLISFYKRFSEEDRKRFKICVDTCHIFAAGYDPIDYMIEWITNFPSSIALVHFNDSQKPKGSKVDLHKNYMDDGFIGYERMSQIADWCHSNKIPMVIEGKKKKDK